MRYGTGKALQIPGMTYWRKQEPPTARQPKPHAWAIADFKRATKNHRGVHRRIRRRGGRIAALPKTLLRYRGILTTTPTLKSKVRHATHWLEMPVSQLAAISLEYGTPGAVLIVKLLPLIMLRLRENGYSVMSPCRNCQHFRNSRNFVRMPPRFH